MVDRERAIVMAYTGICMLKGDKLDVFYDYLEEILGFPVWTHELASEKIWNLIHEKSEKDFFSLCA